MNTITITRTERDLLRAQVWRLVPGLHDDPLPFGTRQEAEHSTPRPFSTASTASRHGR